MSRNIILALLVAGSVIILSCRQNKQTGYDNLFKLDHGRIGFDKPVNCIEIPDLLILLKEVNPNLLYSLMLDSISHHSQLISVSKFVSDTILPMEIVFIENTVKHTAQFLGCASVLTDFGIFDKKGKRFRYKVVKVDNDCFKKYSKKPINPDNNVTDSQTADLYKIMYYFMKNDQDSVLYELSITSPQLHIAQSDSILFILAESFKMY